MMAKESAKRFATPADVAKELAPIIKPGSAGKETVDGQKVNTILRPAGGSITGASRVDAPIKQEEAVDWQSVSSAAPTIPPAIRRSSARPKIGTLVRG